MVYIVEYGIDLGTMGNFLILLNVHIYSGGGGDAHGNAVRAFERDKSGGKGLQRVLAALGLSTQRRWKRAFCVTGLCHDPEDEDDDDEHEDDDDDDSDTSRAGSGIPGSVLETVRQKIGGCSSLRSWRCRRYGSVCCLRGCGQAPPLHRPPAPSWGRRGSRSPSPIHSWSSSWQRSQSSQNWGQSPPPLLHKVLCKREVAMLMPRHQQRGR